MYGGRVSLTKILLLKLASDVALDEGGLADTTVAHKHALEGVNLVCHCPTRKSKSKKKRNSNTTKTLGKKKTTCTPLKKAKRKAVSSTREITAIAEHSIFSMLMTSIVMSLCFGSTARWLLWDVGDEQNDKTCGCVCACARQCHVHVLKLRVVLCVLREKEKEGRARDVTVCVCVFSSCLLSGFFFSGTHTHDGLARQAAVFGLCCAAVPWIHTRGLW